MKDETLRPTWKDERAWPMRIREDGKRACARPGPSHYGNDEEFRIDGYCSVECRDMHELEAALAERTRERGDLRDELAQCESDRDGLESELARLREKAWALTTLEEWLRDENNGWARIFALQGGHELTCELFAISGSQEHEGDGADIASAVISALAAAKAKEDE